jgi:ElaB/YqjD/DUF883 family membrane-anchored ribosome-binding protein
MRILNDGECERSCAGLEIETNVKGKKVGKKKKEAKGVKGENPKMKSQNVSGYLESQTWKQENKQRERSRKKERWKRWMQRGVKRNDSEMKRSNQGITHHSSQVLTCNYLFIYLGPWGGVVVKALVGTVPGSIPGSVTGFFIDIFPSNGNMALGSTQPLVKMSTRNIFWG